MLVLVTLICGGSILLICLMLWNDFQNQTQKPEDVVWPPVAFVFLLMALFTIPKYFKNVPTVELNEQAISFIPIFGKVKTYNLQDIQTLKITGKKPFLPLNDASMEGAQLIFKNGSKEFIFDAMYSNASQIKLRLQELALGESIKLTELKDQGFQIEEEQIQFFKGNQFTSFQGIFFWSLMMALASIPLSLPSVTPIAFLRIAAIILFFFLLFSWFMHYFGLSENYLVIRNHTRPWVNCRYYLPNVREVVFEQEGKRPYSLRVITQDFKSKQYPAGTLRVKHWLNLKSELEKNNIFVRNECVPDPSEPLY